MLSNFKSELAQLVGKNYADKTYLIATSGGADSMVLAHLCKSAGLKGILAHVNFNLRGQESNDDQAFVETVAQELDYPCHVKSFDANVHAQEHKISTQEAARELRYTWFETLRKEIKADYVLIGHHKNDVLETFFINLLRGTGLKGLTGIKAVNEHLLRPLLQIDKEQILKYTQVFKVKYREDSSNASDKYLRNKIRLELLPLIEQMREGSLSKIGEEIGYLNQAWNELSHVLEQTKKTCWTTVGADVYIDKEAVARLQNPSFYLVEWLRVFGFNSTQVLDVWSAKQNGATATSASHKLVNDREKIILSPMSDTVLAESIIKQVPFDTGFFRGKLVSKQDVVFDPSNQKVFLDASQVQFPLTMRAWENGDSIKPFGLNGRKKKVSDILIDAKVDALAKEKVRVCQDATGEIIWVVNHCVSDKVRLQDFTEKILLLEIV